MFNQNIYLYASQKYIYNKAYEFFVFGNRQQILSAVLPLKYISIVPFKRAKVKGIENLL